MTAVLPMRPNTNSTGGSSSSIAQAHRKPSLSSFPPSLANRRTQSSSTQNDTQSSFHYSPAHSSTHLPAFAPSLPTAVARQPRQGPLKSQYPADSPEKHVEYILVASFDIDRGSVMEHQYPGPVGGDEHMLAELMLPDQAHVRAQDWTIFFLHKDAALEETDARGRRRRKRQRQTFEEEVASNADESCDSSGIEDEDEFESEDDSDDELINPMDGPPLVYVLNLVNTKHDTSTRRGAIVKAMAICTRHSFLHIYKPLLLLALEQYFANPSIDTLAELYDAVNSMDLSLMPRLSVNERFVLQSSVAKDLFLEKFETMIAQRMPQRERNDSDANEPGPPSPPLANRNRYGLPRDTHEFECVVKYANVPVPIKVPTALSPETVGDFSLIKLITTFSTPHTTTPIAFSPTHPHLTTSGPYTHPVIVLLNALLTQKRIIFLGHNLPSSEVAHAVLGACALASGGLLRGFTRHAFPYTDLTKIDDLLKVPGFIAGVTNPAFAHKTEWWDLLCDLGTGRMRISSRIDSAPLTEGVAFFQQTNAIGLSTNSGTTASSTGAGSLLSSGAVNLSEYATGDISFMQDVLKAIDERHGENAVRGKFRRWVLKFTRLASAFEETVYGASSLHVQAPLATSSRVDLDPSGADSPSKTKNGAFSLSDLPPEVMGHGYVWPTPQARATELAANATRIEGWRNTRSYYNFVQDLAALYVHRPIKELDLQHLHDKLAKLRLGIEASTNIYLAIAAAVNTDQEICQLLSTVCNEGGPGGQEQGLFYIGLGLFHAKREVREQIAELLARIQDHEAGRYFWLRLGRFSRMAWERVMQARHIRLTLGDE